MKDGLVKLDSRLLRSQLRLRLDDLSATSRSFPSQDKPSGDLNAHSNKLIFKELLALIPPGAGSKRRDPMALT